MKTSMKTPIILQVLSSTALCFLTVLPLLAAEDVGIEKDVAYLGTERSEQLDLYFPPGHPSSGSPAPAVIIIHGGGWVGGDKAAGREQNIGQTLARAGYVCASINYVLGDAAPAATFVDKLETVWPRNLQDCKTAVRYLRSRAKELNIDPTHIGVIGGSAGGHLAAMVGFTDDDDELVSQRLYGDYSGRVQAVVTMYGAHDLLALAEEKQLGTDPGLVKLCRQAAPVTHLSPDDPPTLILHGTEDKTVALRQSELLAAACRRHGSEFRWEVVDGAPHSFDLQPKQRDLRPLVLEFFARHLGPAAKPIPRELRRERFSVAGRPAFVIWPTKPSAKPVPWVMYAPTLGEGLPGQAEAWMFRQLLAAGVAVAGVDVGESYGNPRGREIYDALHKELVDEHGFDPRACLLARSRGGLMLYNWASDRPGKVRCIAGIYPVCNLTSYPGLARASGAYGMTVDQLEQKLREHNPVDRVDPLVKAGIPIFHIHGDTDGVVPLDVNSGLLAQRYRAAGGNVEISVAAGQGHNMWQGFFECQPLVDFIIRNALAQPAEQTEKSPRAKSP